MDVDTGLLMGFGATIVTAIFGSSVITAWITSKAQRPLTTAQAAGEQADAAAVIMAASNELVKNVVARLAALETKVQYLEANQARLVTQLVKEGVEPDLLPMPRLFDVEI